MRMAFKVENFCQSKAGKVIYNARNHVIVYKEN